MSPGRGSILDIIVAGELEYVPFTHRGAGGLVSGQLLGTQSPGQKRIEALVCGRPPGAVHQRAEARISDTTGAGDGPNRRGAWVLVAIKVGMIALSVDGGKPMLLLPEPASHGH